MKYDVAYFEEVEGSMTTDDGQSFMLRVRQSDGRTVMLAFPHDEILSIVEVAAMQLANGRDDKGVPQVSAFKASSFQVARGPDGQSVLTLMVGESGGKLNFVLPGDMTGQLGAKLRSFVN